MQAGNGSYSCALRWEGGGANFAPGAASCWYSCCIALQRTEIKSLVAICLHPVLSFQPSAI